MSAVGDIASGGGQLVKGIGAKNKSLEQQVNIVK